jgi:hypothetical protein
MSAPEILAAVVRGSLLFLLFFWGCCLGGWAITLALEAIEKRRNSVTKGNAK